MELEEKYYASPRWSWEILDCAMPMTFDTYSNCAHQCVYCFAFFQRAIGQGAEDYLHHRVSSVNVDSVKRMFIDPDKYAGDFAGYIKRRFVLQWGGLSDGFDWYERKFRKSLELLRFFKEIDYPISISTKGVWFLDDPEYREVLRDARNTHWKYSIITLDEAKARKLEAGTASPAERFLAFKKLADLGVGATTLRYRPFIIGASDEYIETMVPMAKEAGCGSVTTEFLCIERRVTDNHMARYKSMSDVVGYDVWDFYRKNSYSGSGLMRLNYDIKRPYIKRFEAICDQVGLPFFVSDAHHKEASAGAGCCGLPSTGPLSNYNRGQFAEAIQIAKEKGSVRWSDISSAAEWLKDVSFAGAEGYNHGDTLNRAKYRYHSFYDFMRDMWNTPKSWSSPARYFGGALVPAELDESGDVVYYYNRPYVDEGIKISSVLELKQRAAQRDTLEADGAQYGHVAYPIFIPTKGRADTISTIGPLLDSRLNFTLVVEPQDEEAYRAKFPNADYLVLDRNDAGIGFARQSILNHCRAMGIQWYWSIDDNIHGFYQGQNKCSARAALSFAESLTASYGNLGIVGLDYQQFGFRANNAYSVNRYAYCCTLINANVGIDYRSYFDTKEDVDYLLQLLISGFNSILVHKYAMDKAAMGTTTRGGLSEAYRQKRDHEAAARIASEYPFVELVEKKNGRLDAKIAWRRFRNTLTLLGEPAAEHHATEQQQ